jgi:hypothetical protein
MRREKDIELIAEAIVISSKEMIACVSEVQKVEDRDGGPEEFDPQS